MRNIVYERKRLLRVTLLFEADTTHQNKIEGHRPTLQVELRTYFLNEEEVRLSNSVDGIV